MIKNPSPCIVCTELVSDSTTNFMVALEVPYMNLFLHRVCYEEVKGFLLEFLKENLEKYIKMT